MLPSLPGAEDISGQNLTKRVECVADKQAEYKLTRNPLSHGFTHVDLPSQFTYHFVETFNCVRYMVGRFQTFTYSTIDCDSGKCELQTIRVLIPRGVPEQKMLTLTATTKASFHSPHANVDLLTLSIAVWKSVQGSGRCSH